jgi:hypothetical protein
MLGQKEITKIHGKKNLQNHHLREREVTTIPLDVGDDGH